MPGMGDSQGRGVHIREKTREGVLKWLITREGVLRWVITREGGLTCVTAREERCAHRL